MSISSSTNRFKPRQQNGKVEVLRSETTSRRKLPVNFRQDDLWLFGHELEREIPPAKLMEMENVWVSADGFLFKKGRILPESFAFPANLKNWKKKSILKFLATNYLLKKRRKFKPDAVWIVDDWSHGYFHWLADALPRLLIVKDRLIDSVLLLPQRYEKLAFVRSSLASFGVRNVKFINQEEVLLCRKLIVPTHTAPSGHYNEELIGQVRDLLVNSVGEAPELNPSPRVYISRGKALIRRIKNEEEVIEVLRDFDFKIVHFEDHSFEQQVKIAAQSRHLVSNHGAGLTNMLFMPSGSNVLELRNRTDRINNCYYTLASALNLNYFYQTCEAEDPDEDPHSANLLVDTQALRANLRLMLDS